MSDVARKVLVTGGTSGLGLAMASALAAAGASVVLTGRSGERAAAAAAGLLGMPGAAGMSDAAGMAGVAGIEMDVRDEASVARGVEQAWSRLGGIDMLVNNAGIGMRAVNPEFLTRSCMTSASWPPSSTSG